MKILGIQTSPNLDGLTATMAKAALEGAGAAGAKTELIALKKLRIEACRQCNEGWGICRSEGNCVIEDDFDQVRAKIKAADGMIVSTPTYFGDVSEVTKSFFDRLRRTEMGAEESFTEGTWALSIAAPGGGGGGGPTTLIALGNYFGICRMPIFDAMIVTQRSRQYMLEAARQAGKAMVEHIQKERAKSE